MPRSRLSLPSHTLLPATPIAKVHRAPHQDAPQADEPRASGRLVLSVLTSVAQWEREATAERTSAALAHKARQGEYTGGRIPYGYQLAGDGVHLEPDPVEQRVIEAATRAHRDGLSLRTIARELDGLGFRTRSGRSFHPQQVSRMLAREAA